MTISPRSGLPWVVAAGLLWGAGGITGRALANATALPGVAIASYRLGLGGLLIVLVAARHPPRRLVAWRRILGIATLAAVFQASYFSAMVVGSVTLATLVAIGSSPVFVLLLGARRPRARELGVVALALIGLTLLVGLPGEGLSSGKALACAGLAACAGLSFALFTLLGRRELVGLNAPAAVGFGFLIGGVVLGLLAAPFARVSFAPTAQSLGLLALLAIAPTALAYLCFFHGLPGVRASTATVVALLEPLTGALLAMLLLGERLSPAGWVGAVLLASSILARIQEDNHQRRRIILLD